MALMDSLALLFRKEKNKAATTTAERAEGQSFSLRMGVGGGGWMGGHPSQQFDIVCDLDTPRGHVKNLRHNDPNMDESQALSAFFGDLSDIVVKTEVAEIKKSRRQKRDPGGTSWPALKKPQTSRHVP